MVNSGLYGFIKGIIAVNSNQNGGFSKIGKPTNTFMNVVYYVLQWLMINGYANIKDGSKDDTCNWGSF